MRFKLFHWSDVDFNADYTKGNVVIMAQDIEEALQLIKKDIGEFAYLELKNKESDIYENPVCLDFVGSA